MGWVYGPSLYNNHPKLMKYQIYGVRNVNLCDRESYVEPRGVLYIHELHAKLAL